jgi:hypothetical protein
MNVKIRLTRAENIARLGAGPVELPIEEYLCGVVPAEVYESSAMDALKAQAVAARTFALKRVLAETVMDDTTAFQAYRAELAASCPRSRQAVEETTGQTLCYGGEVIDCFYSSSNGGQTKRSGDVWSRHYPYYISKADPWDAAANEEKPTKPSHGIGMSQVGAMWAAKNGVPYHEILAFYYDGAALLSDYGKGGVVGFTDETPETEGGSKMNLHKLIFTNNACYKAGRTISVTGIMVHSTGANNPNLKRYVGPDDGLLGKNQYNNHWNQDKPDGRQVCVHAFIGKLADGSIATYQTLPWDMRGWHGGSGSKGSVNDTHIGFEICEDALTDAAYFRKVFNEAVELCVYLCKLYNLDPMKDGVIIGHYEGHSRGIASNHGDPRNWFPKHGESMDSFRAAVKKGLAGSIPTPAPDPAPEPAVAIKKGDTVKLADNATYYDGKAIPAWVKGQNWIVGSISGDRAVIDKNVSGTNAINSPVNTRFLTVVGTVSTPAFTAYTVKVTADTLNIRKGPGTNYGANGSIKDKGVYTIVEESTGPGAIKWGKLKSGAGWISLDYTQKR